MQKRIKQTSIRKECDLNVLLPRPKCSPAKVAEERNLIMPDCSCINGGFLLITNPVLKKKKKKLLIKTISINVTKFKKILSWP